MKGYTGQKVMSGTELELWINDKYMAQVTEFKSEITLTKEKVNMVKHRGVSYKYTGWEGKGSCKFNHVSSYFVKLLADDMKNGKTTVCTIVGKVSDPDVSGIERVALSGVVFDKLTLMDASAKKLMEDAQSFSFDNFEVLDTVDD
jgi:uncharacterized protein YbaA (DUF1428 family)